MRPKHPTGCHLWGTFILLLTNINIVATQRLCCSDTSGTSSPIPHCSGGREEGCRIQNSFRQGKSSKRLNSVEYFKANSYILLCASVSRSRRYKVWCTHQLPSERGNIRQFWGGLSTKAFEAIPAARNSLRLLTFTPNIYKKKKR